MIYNKSKIKGPLGRVYPIVIIITYLIIIIEVQVIDNPFYGHLAVGIFFIVMGIIQLLRYRLVVHFILGLLLGTGCWHVLVWPYGPDLSNGWLSFLSIGTYLVHVLILVLFLVLLWPVIYGHEKLEANARRLFKLASELIYESSDGFTDRPFSAGKLDASNEDILGFIRFLSGRKIGKAFYHEKNVYLAFSLGKSPLKVDDPQEISYVRFDKDKNMSVHISKFDYRQYKERLSFDQLCGSLGNVFKRFYKYYHDGNDTRIITELKLV